MDVITYALCKKFVSDSIAASDKIGFKKVDILPEVGESTYIYLVPKAKTLTANTLDEYIWINNNWEYLGNMEVDLSEYAKLTDLETALQDYVKITDVKQADWKQTDSAAADFIKNKPTTWGALKGV